MQTFVEKFLGRNYHMALLIITVSFLLCLWGRMTGGEFASLVGAVFAGFRGGDVLLNWIHRPDKSDSVPSEPSPQSPPLILTGTDNDKPAG